MPNRNNNDDDNDNDINDNVTKEREKGLLLVPTKKGRIGYHCYIISATGETDDEDVSATAWI